MEGLYAGQPQRKSWVISSELFSRLIKAHQSSSKPYSNNDSTALCPKKPWYWGLSYSRISRIQWGSRITYIVQEVDGHEGAPDPGVVALRQEDAVAVRKGRLRIEVARSAGPEIPVGKVSMQQLWPMPLRMLRQLIEKQHVKGHHVNCLFKLSSCQKWTHPKPTRQKHLLVNE